MTATARSSTTAPKKPTSTRRVSARQVVPSTRTSTRDLRSTTKPSPVSPPTTPCIRPQQAEMRVCKKYRRRSHGWTKRKPKKPATPYVPPTHYTCRICSEDLPVADFVKYIPPRKYIIGGVKTPTDVPYACISHLARAPQGKRDPVCKSCIGLSMASRHELVGARRVSTGCLEPNCMTSWDSDFILTYFPKDERFEKYNADMLDVYLQDSPLITCVKEGCGARALADATYPGYPQVECTSATCRTRFCVKCIVPWHTGQTCAEYTAAQVNSKMTDPEKETLELMQSKDGKRCPNCYLVIEKDGGCNSMLCSGCGKFFDWETAASAVPGSKKPLPVDRYGNAVHEWMKECEVDRWEMTSRVEKKLIKIVSRVLGMQEKNVRRTDSFFKLGGDSLSARQLEKECRKQRLHFTSSKIFRSQSIAELAVAAKVKD